MEEPECEAVTVKAEAWASRAWMAGAAAARRGRRETAESSNFIVTELKGL